MSRPVKPCSVEGCERRHYGHGYCRLHLRRLRSNGDPLTVQFDRSQTIYVCQIEGCEKPHHAHGLCNAHQHRARRHGDPLAGGQRINGDVATRLRAKSTITESGCWQWTGWLNERGYGYAGDGNRRVVIAHRLSYETFVGPIPEGLEVDHLCNNRACINPDHLEPVTHAENLRRAQQREASTCPAS